MPPQDDSARDPVRLPAARWAAESPFVGEAAAEEQAPIHPWYQGYTPFVEGRELEEEEYAPEAGWESDLTALEAESPLQRAFDQGRTSLIEPGELEGLGRESEQETGEEEGGFERDVSPAPPPTKCGFHGPNGVFVTEADLRSAVANAALDERKKWWGGTSGTAQKEDNPARFGDLVRYWVASLKQVGEPIHPGKLEAVQKAALDPNIPYGNLKDVALDKAIKRFGDAEKKVNDWTEEVYKRSAAEDLAKAKAEAAAAEVKAADIAVKAAAKAVKAAEALVKDARRQSGSAAQAALDSAQAALDRERNTLREATTARSIARKKHDAAKAGLRVATRARKDAKRKYDEARDAREPLKGPASAWKPADRQKTRKALLANAAGTDPQNIDVLVEEALRLAHRSRADVEAWSAVFVVSCVRAAAIDRKLEVMDTSGAHVGKDGLLKASQKHAEYVVEARERKGKGDGGTYHAFEPHDPVAVVEIGDIICTDRRNFIEKPVSLHELKIGTELHCDIVTSIKSENGKPLFAETVGGNVGHTVRRRQYPLDDQGRLVVSRGKLFAQEEDDGSTFSSFDTKDPVPPTLLAVKSTGRIFALLRPVVECKKPAPASTNKGTPTGKEERFLSYLLESLESPFLNGEILPTDRRNEFDSSVEKLADESPFVGALEERRSRLDEDQLEEEEAPGELEGGEELEAEEVWEELEEEQLTPQADQKEEESLDDEGAPLREDETALESPEDLEELYSHAHEHELELAEELAELKETEGLESDEEEHFEYDVSPLGSATNDHPLREIADGQRGQLPDDILAAILTTGESDANDLTNRVFWRNHPNLSRKPLDPKDPKQKALRDEWGMILSRQVKPIIWLRQIIGQLDRHRGDIPREFLLGWIAAESDGRVSTVSTLGERGYFQIMWQSGEAKEQLGLTRAEFLRLSTDREFSIEKGVQLAKTYRQHFLRKYPSVPDGSDLLWRLTKGRHALPTALDKALDRLVKAGTTITWQAVSQSLPKMASHVDLTFDFAAKLKPLADLVPAPPATTPEFYAQSAPSIPGSGYEDRVFEVAAEQATEEDLAEFDEEEMQGSDMPTGDWEQAILSEEIAEFLPPRVFPSEIGQVSVAYETPPLPKGVHPFKHWFQPMKRDRAANSWIPDGDEKPLEPIDPGFFDARGELKTSSLNDSLKNLLTRNTEFSRHLSRDALRDEKAKAGDKIHVALVDLTGSKLLDPEFAGWGSMVAVYGASCPKVAALYAAFQLRNDLKHVAAAEKITKTAELIRVMRERWKKEGVEGPPRLEQFLYPYTNPPALEFSADVDEAIDNIIDQHNANRAAMVLINAVGFPYIASLMWQSGLRHPARGGLWLTSNYAWGTPWRRPSKPPPAPVYGHNATALSLATFFTLLAQGRLVRSALPRTIKTSLSTASWFSDTLPSASIASKVGLLQRCLRRGPKMKDGRPVLGKDNKPVQECKEWEATHVHEAGLIENERFRYAVAIMTTGIPTGVSLLKKLIGELDGLIRANNP